MTTTLENCMTELSKQIGDYWASTSTSSGSSTTIIDTALIAKANDWISDSPQEMYDRITSGTYDEEERKISSLSNTAGTLTTLAHGGTIASGVTYEIHRMFNASEKRRALIYAAKHAFPYIHSQIRDDSRTAGNWLRNGDVEIWALTTVPDNFVADTLTCAENTTAPYYYRGSSSAKLSGSAGSLYQSNTQVPDLMDLAGKTVTFTAKVNSNTASDTRLSIYDGTTTTYSSYHDGDSVVEKLTVTAIIADPPSSVKFSIHRGASSTVYADDFIVTGPTRDKIYIGDLGLAQNYPHEIRQSLDTSINDEPWGILRKYNIGSDGYLYLDGGTRKYRLRIKGIGYLDFLASGASSTDWAATIAIDSPQTEILVAEAIIYLYTQLILPNFTPGTNDKFKDLMGYWMGELGNRQIKFGMKAPDATVKWS